MVHKISNYIKEKIGFDVLLYIVLSAISADLKEEEMIEEEPIIEEPVNIEDV